MLWARVGSVCSVFYWLPSGIQYAIKFMLFSDQ